jgi:hypothetical protein
MPQRGGQLVRLYRHHPFQMVDPPPPPVVDQTLRQPADLCERVEGETDLLRVSVASAAAATRRSSREVGRLAASALLTMARLRIMRQPKMGLIGRSERGTGRGLARDA